MVASLIHTNGHDSTETSSHPPLHNISNSSNKINAHNSQESPLLRAEIGPELTARVDSLSRLAGWVPMRLTAAERALLTVLEQTLHVSEYTDHVDVTSAARRGGLKTRRILDGILEVCHLATGLAITSGQERIWAELCYPDGINNHSLHNMNNLSDKKKNRLLKRLAKNGKNNKKNLARSSSSSSAAGNDEDEEGASHSRTYHWVSREPAENAVFFQTMFEIGRRSKVLNPSSMRTTYGKLMYLLQDAQNPTVAKSLGFSLHKDLLLVGPYLEQHGCKDLLDDPRLECAVQYISDRDRTTGQRLDRAHVQALVQGKQAVADELVAEYSSKTQLPDTDVRRAIESLADAIAYIESNVRPVQRMLDYLEANFDRDVPTKGFSLALRSTRTFASNTYGKYGYSAYSSGSSEGPTLSHTHSEQYTFVWQSLRLWSKVMRHMHRLWVCADEDLLSTTTSYHLFNTGQGLNRVQACPRVRQVMTSLLSQTQKEAGSAWVGLSVIHLGDRDVPNALIFIDKYTQIPRFLNPLVAFLQDLDDLCADARIAAYIQAQFESAERLQRLVLTDYFKHGFDGSGDDGGSCIDGRLTSSWNWTSRIAKKEYYQAFMLSGFQGFDGDFR